VGGKIRKHIETKKGSISIESKLTFDRIQDLVFASDFKSHAQYKSIYTKRGTLEFFVKNGGSVALAILDNKTIIGFAVLDDPDPKERWAGLGERIMMELKAVEVLREYRNQSIARHLLFNLLSDPRLEQKIVYLTAYSWTWDLDYSGLDIQSYKKMLKSLYARFRFIEYLTNEPNICLKPENFFMARIGKNVPQKLQEDFQWLRFGLNKDDIIVNPDIRV